ncbi:MAG: WD40 repeat domain-containing protein [Gemmataceae bacterium]
MPSLNPLSRRPKSLKLVWQARVSDHVIALAWSPDRAHLAAAEVSGQICLFEAKTGALVKAWPGHGFGTTSVSWHPTKGTLLASSGQDGNVAIWDVSSSDTNPTQTLPAGSPWVTKTEWSPDGQYLSAAAGKHIRLWDASGKLVREYPEHVSTVSDIQWKPKSQLFASSCYSRLQVWTPEDDEPRQTFEWKGSILRLDWSPDGRYISTGDQDSTVHFWIIKTGKDLMMSGYANKVQELSWDCTSRYLATGGGEVPCVWDCSGKGPAGTTPYQLEAHEEKVTALAYQHRGKYLASGGLDGLVALWQPEYRQTPLAKFQTKSSISQLAWSHADTSLAVGTDSGEVFLLRAI